MEFNILHQVPGLQQDVNPRLCFLQRSPACLSAQPSSCCCSFCLFYRISPTCIQVIQSESGSRSVLSDSLQPHGLYSPWNSPGQNTEVGSRSLLQGSIPPNQGIEPRSPALQADSLPVSEPGKPKECSEVCAQIFLALSFMVPCFLRFPLLPSSHSGASDTIL